VNADWRSAYWRDQRYPNGIGGITHVRSRRHERSDLRAAVRHLRKVKQATKADVWTIVRLHRIYAVDAQKAMLLPRMSGAYQ
jgi:hypothetical protein